MPIIQKGNMVRRILKRAVMVGVAVSYHRVLQSVVLVMQPTKERFIAQVFENLHSTHFLTWFQLSRVYTRLTRGGTAGESVTRSVYRLSLVDLEI